MKIEDMTAKKIIDLLAKKRNVKTLEELEKEILEPVVESVSDLLKLQTAINEFESKKRGKLNNERKTK